MNELGEDKRPCQHKCERSQPCPPLHRENTNVKKKKRRNYKDDAAIQNMSGFSCPKRGSHPSKHVQGGREGPGEPLPFSGTLSVVWSRT